MVELKTLPKFEGRSLIEILEFISQANFLVGDFGKAVIEEYNGRVKADYNGNRVLNVLNYNGEVATGSNPFAVVLINQIIAQEGLRVATPADLERILKLNALSLRGTYEDSALVLRSVDEPNKYLAKVLYDQAKERQQKIKRPVMIPLSGLELQTDQHSPQGLSFRLRENAELIYAPILNKDGDFSSSNIDEKTGLPKELGKGDRHHYKHNSGLCGLFLRGLDLRSNRDDLASSDDSGRVVVVSGEATQKNLLHNYIVKMQKERDAQIEKATKKYEEAIKVGTDIMQRKE